MAGGVASAAEEAGPTYLLGLSVMADKEAGGLRITSVQRGFPAAEAGLSEGDVVLQAGSLPLTAPAGLAERIAAGAGAPLPLLVARGTAAPRYVAARPLAFPDPDRDARDFPYPTDFLAAPRFAVTLEGRGYEPVTPEAVFALAPWLAQTAFGVDHPLSGRRLLLATAMACRDLTAPFFDLSDPDGGLGAPVSAVPSPLFDPRAARAERARCETHLAAASGATRAVGRVAGRFAADPEGVYGGAGAVFLVDALYFDDDHLTRLDELAGLVGFAKDLWTLSKRFEGLEDIFQ